MTLFLTDKDVADMPEEVAQDTGDVAKRLAQELATLSEADRLFVAQQTSQLISHNPFSRRRK
jgi:hypothetical protein